MSNLLVNDLGSRSKVSVSPTKLNWLSNKITLSKFWNKNLVENKNFLISFSINSTLSLEMWSIVLSIILMWLTVFFRIKFGSIFFIYRIAKPPTIKKIIRFINKNFFNIDKFFNKLLNIN